MDADDVLETIRRKEFRPVELHLANGVTIVVPHPDYLFVFPSRKSAIVFPDQKHFEIIDLASVVRAVPVRESEAA